MQRKRIPIAALVTEDSKKQSKRTTKELYDVLVLVAGNVSSRRTPVRVCSRVGCTFVRTGSGLGSIQRSGGKVEWFRWRKEKSIADTMDTDDDLEIMSENGGSEGGW